MSVTISVLQSVGVITIFTSVLFDLSTSYCIRLPTSNISGYLVHATGYTAKECRWDFDYNIPNRTNLMMDFKVLKSGAVGTSFPHYNFYTPDDPGRKWWQKGPFCRIYAKPGSNLTNCKPGEKRQELCENVIQQSVDWPPTIKTDFALYSAVMSYQFIDCEADVPKNRTKILHNIALDSNTSQNADQAYNSWQNTAVHATTMTGTTSFFYRNNVSTYGSRGLSVTDTIVIAIATVVLAIFCLLIIISLWQKWGHKESFRNSAIVQLSTQNNQRQNSQPSFIELEQEKQKKHSKLQPPPLKHDYANVNVISRPNNDEYLVPIRQPISQYEDLN